MVPTATSGFLDSMDDTLSGCDSDCDDKMSHERQASGSNIETGDADEVG